MSAPYAAMATPAGGSHPCLPPSRQPRRCAGIAAKLHRRGDSALVELGARRDGRVARGAGHRGGHDRMAAPRPFCRTVTAKSTARSSRRSRRSSRSTRPWGSVVATRCCSSAGCSSGLWPASWQSPCCRAATACASQPPRWSRRPSRRGSAAPRSSLRRPPAARSSRLSSLRATRACGGWRMRWSAPASRSCSARCCSAPRPVKLVRRAEGGVPARHGRRARVAG